MSIVQEADRRARRTLWDAAAGSVMLLLPKNRVDRNECHLVQLMISMADLIGGPRKR